MKTLVVANQKGGVGKTSTLVHLAWFASIKGAKVAVIDLDTQGNASFTLSDHDSGIGASSLLRGEPISEKIALSQPGISLIHADAKLADTEKLPLGNTAENFRSAIAELAKHGFDVCLIDTAPSLGVTMAAALLNAGFVVSPIELEAYSIQGIRKMLLTVGNLKKGNRGLTFLGMIPSKMDGRNPRHARHLQELTSAYPASIIPCPIGLRSSIADALSSKQPVWEIRKTSARKAASEVRYLSTYIFDMMGVTF